MAHTLEVLLSLVGLVAIGGSAIIVGVIVMVVRGFFGKD